MSIFRAIAGFMLGLGGLVSAGVAIGGTEYASAPARQGYGVQAFVATIRAAELEAADPAIARAGADVSAAARRADRTAPNGTERPTRTAQAGPLG